MRHGSRSSPTPFLAAREIPAEGFGTVRFHYVEERGKILVHLDLAKVRALWSAEGIYRRSPDVTSYDHDLPFDGHAARLRSLIDVIRGRERPGDPERRLGLPPVIVDLLPGGFTFGDCRHRITLLTAAGYTSVPALVRDGAAAAVACALGAVRPDPRIEVRRFASFDDKLDAMCGPEVEASAPAP